MRRRQAGARSRQARERYSDDNWDDEDVHELDLDSLEAGPNRSKRLYWILGSLLSLGLIALLGYQFLWPSGDSESGDAKNIEATE